MPSLPGPAVGIALLLWVIYEMWLIAREGRRPPPADLDQGTRWVVSASVTAGASIAWILSRKGSLSYRAAPIATRATPHTPGPSSPWEGWGLGLGSLLSIAAAVAIALPSFLRRIAVEETAHRRGMGEPYERYRLRTKRLVPGVW